MAYPWGFPVSRCFINANIKKSDELINKYKAEIKDMNDLLHFPLEHCFNGEEYTEYEAMEAYKIRANELTGAVL